MNQRCYIYTRVSTEMQVDGYSLDAQKEEIKEYTQYKKMTIVDEYSDVGSGKNVKGRPDFLRMINDIKEGKDKVDFVLVFKLSRFGRNAADVLGTLQIIQDYGVNLISVADNIDSSQDGGKLMISVLSAVSEIERENILVQTMEGRKQKAREGKWNGGFAPYGYKLENGELVIAKDEVKVVEVIYDKFTSTNMGINAVASYLNNNGYKKKKRQNGTLDAFSASFVKAVIDNPVYCGKLAYGRRKNEKIQGERNQFHIVKQKEFPVYDGIHEAIVSEEIWQAAQEKRKITGFKHEKRYSLEHAHILSGILKCPNCGAPMYGNVNRKKKKDGTYYRDYFYYACKHRRSVSGHKCNYSKQWSQDLVDDAVAEIITKLVHNEKFENAIKDKINSKIDTAQLEENLETLKKSYRQENTAKNKLAQQIDGLDVMDSSYERKYKDMQERLNKFYERIDSIEIEMEEVKTRIQNVKLDRLNSDGIYNILKMFDQFYDEFTDFEKQEFIKSFVEKIEIYPEELEDGRILKNIKFRFPVFFNGSEVSEISWDKESTVETVCLLHRK
ncbi:transposon gamma-delta resolvase [Oxobacter pfennigii]|uniref:Transposon gamma-delta resolvase n=2 Tax=Clostridia TaxID=186801 RepID=A0A0P9AE10_9CLOT|nr:recombinase family protein [Oxobacter pfennigii]KPU43470.1 transposon gamma-delta resolvase [Oxobacter pfennigii]